MGSETLLGREIEDVLAHFSRACPCTPYAANGEGNFGSQDGEAVFVEAFDAAAVRDHRAIVLAGSVEGARKVYTLAKELSSPPRVIDCTGYLENEPEARIVSSSQLPVGPAPDCAASGGPRHRANLREIQRRARQSRAALRICSSRPVSVASRALPNCNSKRLPCSLQTAGQESFRHPTEFQSAVPLRRGRSGHTCRYRAAHRASPCHAARPTAHAFIRLVQAPVFHGYSISLWVEFETASRPLPWAKHCPRPE